MIFVLHHALSVSGGLLKTLHPFNAPNSYKSLDVVNNLRKF